MLLTSVAMMLIHITIVSNEEGDDGQVVFKSITPEITNALNRFILGDELYRLNTNGNHGKEVKEEDGKKEREERQQRKRWVQITRELAEELGYSAGTIRCWVSQKKVSSQIVFEKGLGTRVVNYEELKRFVDKKTMGEKRDERGETKWESEVGRKIVPFRVHGKV